MKISHEYCARQFDVSLKEKKITFGVWSLGTRIEIHEKLLKVENDPIPEQLNAALELGNALFKEVGSIMESI